MHRSSVNRALALLLSLGVALAACGGDDGQSATPSNTVQMDSGRTGDGVDAERELSTDDSTAADPVDVDGQTESTDAADVEEATEDRSAEAPSADAATAEASTDSGGLFGEDDPAPEDLEPSDGDAEGRLDDNRFEDYGYRDFVAAADDPLSTFALDVDTGSYSVGRSYFDEGSLPPPESVRPEEYVNVFDYDYDTPRSGLEVSVDGGPSPFNDANVLVRVGVQGEMVAAADRGSAALTFVIDTSGSMDRDDRLGLVKESLSILVDELNDDDTVAIVTYSDTSGIVLEPTEVSEKEVILDAIDALGPGGSTNLESGLVEGYALAREAYNEGGINRVVLASDGLANAGITDHDQLAAMVQEDAENGIDLVTVGFGMGQYNDITMEQLADNGDGFYAYVDTLDEAQRLFEDDLTSTLLTIAKNAKIQVEFDVGFVDSYRLIGFENRGVRDSEFREDSVDAGELGAGHQVTAIYELDLADDLALTDRAELGVVSLRWEDPESSLVTEVDQDIDLRDIDALWTDTADDFQLATVVVTFAEWLRDNPYADAIVIDDLADEADRLADELATPEARELADLIRDATELD
jgi:Ca-activated chloride channel homolog